MCFYSTSNVLNYKPEDVSVVVLPMFHIYGQIVVLMSALYSGSRLVVLPKFEPELYLKAVSKYKVQQQTIVCLIDCSLLLLLFDRIILSLYLQATFLNVAPPLVLFLAKHPLVSKYDLSSLHTLFCGAAAISAKVAEDAVNRIKVACFRQGALWRQISTCGILLINCINI